MGNRVIRALGLACFAICCGHSTAAELACTPEPTNMVIGAGDAVVCSVGEIGDEDSFRFQGAAGQRVLIEAVRYEGGSPCVELFDPQFVRRAVECAGQAARIDLTLGSSGEHVIRLSEWAADMTLQYRLSLESLAPPSPAAQPLEAGQATSGELVAIGDANLFRFTASAGRRILLEAVRYGGGSPCVEVFDPEGIRRAVECAGHAARVDLTLGSSGEHVIRISEWASDMALQYRLSMESLAPPSPTAQPLQFGQATSGELVAVGDANLFRFAAAAGRRILLEAVRYGGGSPCVEVFDPEGVRRAVECAGHAARIDLTLAGGGEHVIRVSEWASDMALQYRLSMESLAPPSPTAQPLQVGQATTGELVAIGDANLFRFTTAAGRRILAEAVRYGGGSPCVEVFDPEGIRRAVECAGHAARIDLTLAKAGEHVIRISEWASDMTLQYRFSLESLAPPSPTAQPLQFSQARIGQLAAMGEAHLFVVGGAAGDRIEPVVTRQAAGSPCVEVFNPEGVRIAVECGGQSARTGFLTLAATGPHIIRVSEWASDDILTYRLEAQCFGVCPLPPAGGGPTTPVTELSLGPPALFFNFTEGAAAAARIFKVQNTGTTAADISMEASTTSGGNWLLAAPTSASLAAGQNISVSARANPTGLPPGTYSGQITVRDSRGGNSVHAVVTMSVSRATRSVLLSQTGLTFPVTAGGQPATQGFRLFNVGAGSLDWTLRASTLSGDPWLRVTPDSGSTTPAPAGSEVEVTVDPAGLAPGVYYGLIEATAPEADNSPQSLTVVLNLLPPDAPPAPEISPAGLVFVGQPGIPGPQPQPISIRNRGNAAVNFTVSTSYEGGPQWFSVNPVSGIVAGGGSASITVSPNAAQLARGVYRGRLQFDFGGGAVSEAALLLVVAPSGAALSDASGGGPPRQQQAACTAQQLLPIFATPSNSFRVQAGWPTPIEVIVVDDCGREFNDGAVQVSFSNGDAPLGLSPQGRGRWGRTWPARPSQQLTEVVLTAEAVRFEPLLRGAAQIGGDLSLDFEAPVVGGGAIISAASFDTTAPLAPGDLISIFGQKLAEAEGASVSLPLAKELSGTIVSVAGRRIPLLYVSENQINGMIPYGLPVHVEHEMVVQRGRTYALPAPVVLAEAQPAVFTKDQTGAGQGIIVTAQGALADAANPVSAGDVVVIYGAGFGDTDPGIEAGEATPSDPLSHTRHPVTVTIGGLAATVHFAGPTPQFTGLYQVNAEVPPGIPAGGSVPVVVSVAGRSGPPVTIAVR